MSDIPNPSAMTEFEKRSLQLLESIDGRLKTIEDAVKQYRATAEAYRAGETALRSSRDRF